MGKRGPAPKENVQRRNAESRPVMVEDDPKRKVVVPVLTTYVIEGDEVEGHGARKSTFKVTRTITYGAHARERWQDLWNSPLAQQYRPEMMDPLWRWIKLVDRFHHLGDHSVLKDLLQIEKEYALTWSAQKRERLMFFRTPTNTAAAEVDPDAPATAVRTDAERRARVKAVADG